MLVILFRDSHSIAEVHTQTRKWEMITRIKVEFRLFKEGANASNIAHFPERTTLSLKLRAMEHGVTNVILSTKIMYLVDNFSST